MTEITIHDKCFQPYLSESLIEERVSILGVEITRNFEGRELLVIGVLKGSFIFLADLCRKIDLPIQTFFIQISSYNGIKSSGSIDQIIGLNTDLEGKNILIIEDIVDTGASMNYLVSQFSLQNPASVSIATLLFKPDAFQFNYAIDYVGFEIPNKFVVGYGLDYDGLGRNLPAIYQLKTS